MKIIFITFPVLLQVISVSGSPLSTSIDTRSSLICGQTGYDAGTESFFSENGVKAAFCEEQCGWQGCKSYAWGRGICQLYNVPAASNFVAVQDSIYTFWDAGCPSSATSTVGTTSTTSAVRTTTKAATTASNSQATTKTTSKGIATSAKTTTSKVLSTTKTSLTTSKPTTSTTKATTTSSTSSTSTTPSQTPSSTPLCGPPGYEKISSFMSTSNGGSYNACLADCKSQPTCKSISFATEISVCNLYAFSATDVLKPTTNSPFNFYDADCATTYKTCGVAGYDRQFQAYWDGWSGYTADSCAAECVKDSKCGSYAYGKGECHLYQFPVNGNINAQPDSPYSFSDATCVS